MNDLKIFQHIRALVDEEHPLRAKAVAGEAAARLKHVGEELDQCWDLLRQRRAKREFGDNADGAAVRDLNTVERYEG
jgi:hypothetical protein